jgi:hypothetical protein
MSPASRRRAGVGRRSRSTAALVAAEESALRREAPLDALTSRLGRLGPASDGLAAEAVLSWVLSVVGDRGPDAEENVATFCRRAVSDERAATTARGLEALALLAVHGHADVRDEAAAAVVGADPDVRAAASPWLESVGRVHVVETGLLRTADGRELVAHVLLDHDDPAAGPRHLVSVAVAVEDARVHLLDVRARAAADVLAPMAGMYAGSADPVWTWGTVDDVRGAAGQALATTAGHSSSTWPVLDVDGAPTRTWSLGLHRLTYA